MATIALNWELGADYGHIGRFLPIAKQLRARGHRPVCILRDISRAEQVLGAQDIEYLQAPMWLPQVQGLPPDINFTETLLRFGFLQPDGLVALARAWRGLWTLLGADLLIFDHAPNAGLAARGFGRPRLLIGNSFAIPPQASPLPRYRWWQTAGRDEARMAESEARLVANLKAAALRLAIPPVDRVCELFQAEAKLICAWPQLDVYGPRPDASYIGPINNLDMGAPPAWPEGQGPRVFAYIKPHYRHFEPLLAAMAQAPARFLIFAPGIATALTRKYDQPHLRFSATPLRMREVRRECDLAICHAGGTTDVMLGAGKPVLQLPMQMEQTMTSHRTEALGAGLHLPLEGNPGELRRLLKKLLGSDSHRLAAEALAGALPATADTEAIDRIMLTCEQLLAGRVA